MTILFLRFFLAPLPRLFSFRIFLNTSFFLSCIAVFKKTEDGRYKGTFPDLEGCFGEGDTLDEAIESANAAAFDWISVELSEEVPELPPITDPDDMELEDEDVVRNIQVNIRLYDGWDE